MPAVIEEREVEAVETPCDMPPIFGRCPVCGKPLYPRNKITGVPEAPPVGTGYLSRAKCQRCGTIICYIGNGEWRVLTDADWADERAEVTE